MFAQTRVDLKAPGAADVALGATHGAAFHVSILPTDPAPLSPHLALWFDVRDAHARETARVKAALVEIIDSLMREGRAHQAFVAAWDWRPALTLHATPYELACGVHGQCTTRQAWVEKYLHAIAEIVWLGPALLGRVPDFQARTLAREGTTYRELLDQLRLELSTRHLANPRMSLGEIAFVLGFSELSAFHRAFRRWTGTTPAEFRAAKPGVARGTSRG